MNAERTEMVARQMLRGSRPCVQPHGSLDDLLFGDATITEQRLALDPGLVPEPEPVAPSLLERIGAWWRRLGG